MTIRLKLALILMAGIALSLFAAGLTFFSLQRAALDAAEQEKRKVLMQQISRVAEETMFSTDPLILVDYLRSLKRVEPDVLFVRIFMGGQWEILGRQSAQLPALVEEIPPVAPRPEIPLPAVAPIAPASGPTGEAAEPARIQARPASMPGYSRSTMPGFVGEGDIELPEMAPPPPVKKTKKRKIHRQDDEAAIKPLFTKTPLRVQIGFSRETIERRLDIQKAALYHDLLRTGAITALAGFLFALLLSWTFTHRIVKVEDALAKIGQGELTAVLPYMGHDEIGRLAENVNAMAGRLKEIDALKKTFVASVTHELRSPLGAIDSYVRQMLSEPTQFNSDHLGHLERISANVQRLSHFVTNLLDMAKIERGKLEFTPRMGDLLTIVEDTVIFFKGPAQNSGLSLEYRRTDELPPFKLDPDLIAHVMTNFISNALKFTRRGGSIQVSVRRVGENAEVSVADSGMGIPKAALGRIFAPFERVPNPLKATGVGLGLAISKAIIEMHGGSIGVESELNKGSRFYFRIPISLKDPPRPSLQDRVSEAPAAQAQVRS